MSTTLPAAGHPEPVEAELADAVAQLSFEVMSHLTQLAAEEEVSLTQLRMLAVLRDRRPRMAELAAVLGLDRSSVSGLIARAEERGMVRRTVAEGDRRGFRVELTDVGSAYAAQVGARAAARLGVLLEPLDAGGRTALAEALRIVLQETPAAALDRSGGRT